MKNNNGRQEVTFIGKEKKGRGLGAGGGRGCVMVYK